jgi:CheY-like chemotaxis protein
VIRDLSGARVLLVEDEALIAMTLDMQLSKLGCQVEWHATVPSALRCVRPGAFDVAMLDVNVGHTPVYPVAAALAAHGVPFLFLTGYELVEDDRYQSCATIRKPADIAKVIQALKACLGINR